MSFTTGDRVCWESQAGGAWKKKIGIIVAVVQPHAYPKDCVPMPRKFYNTAAMDGGGLPRDHESYLVEVNESKTGRGKPKLFWPRVFALRHLA